LDGAVGVYNSGQPAPPPRNINTPPMQAGYTGGAPGTPTYGSWTFVAPNAGVPVSFLNPSNSSSQIVRFTGVAANDTQNQDVRVTVTDSLGNTSQQIATATAVHNSSD
jgi:hypothetical protein